MGASVMDRRRRVSYEITDRDAAVLLWIGEQLGVRLEVLTLLLGRYSAATGGGPVSRARGFQVIKRWESAGLVIRRYSLGNTWVTLTREGYSRVGLAGTDPWPVPVTQLDHTHCVALVRLWFEVSASEGGASWVSERSIHRRAKAGEWNGQHVPDGILVQDPFADAPDYLACEVELTHKTVARYVEILQGFPSGVKAVVYFVRDDAFRALLFKHLESAGARIGRQLGYGLDIRSLPTLDEICDRARRKGGVW